MIIKIITIIITIVFAYITCLAYRQGLEQYFLSYID